MARAPLWLMYIPVSFLGITGCASTLRLSDETRYPYLPELRTEYLASYPDSPYRENVSRGEVSKGMDTFGVLAAWGHPQRRTRTGSGAEEWLFVDQDERSGERTEYALLFRGGVVSSWSSRRDSDPMRLEPLRSVSDVPITEPSFGKDIPHN